MRTYPVLCFLALPLNYVWATPAFSVAPFAAANDTLQDEGILLHPAIHPDHNMGDLDNLKAKKESSMYYASQPGTVHAAASVVQLTHLYPAVHLEKSRFIAAITCNAAPDTMTVYFTTRTAFQTAFDDWSMHRGGLLLVAFVDGCGAGVDSAERSFHVVDHIAATDHDLRIVCSMATVPLHHTVHLDERIKFHVVKYKHTQYPGPQQNPTRRETLRREAHSLAEIMNTPSKAIENAWTAAGNFFGGIFSGQINVLKTGVEYILDKYKVSYNGGLENFNINTTDLRPFDSKFNGTDSYLLFGTEGEVLPPSKSALAKKLGKGSATFKGKIELHCVGCAFALSVNYIGHFEATLAGTIYAANVTLDANLTATLVLGILASAGVHFETRPFELLSKPVPRAGVVIKKLLKLGTIFTVTALVELDITASGAASFGYVCEWGPVGATLDMTNTERSVAYGDWTLENKCKQQAGFSASLSVSLAPSLSFALSLVAQLLPDSDYNTKAGITITEKISLPLTAELTTESCPNYDGGALKLSAEIKDELSIIGNFGSQSRTLNAGNITAGYKIAEKCIPFSEAFAGTAVPPSGVNHCDKQVDFGPSPGGWRSLRKSLGFYQTPNNSVDSTQHILLDPTQSEPPTLYLTHLQGSGPSRLQRDTCYPGELRVVETGSYDDYEWISDDGPTVLGTYDNLLFHTPATTTMNGIGPISLALMDKVPLGSRILILALTLLNRGDANFDMENDGLQFFDSDLNVYYIAVCVAFDGSRKPFLFTRSVTETDAFQLLANNTFDVAGEPVSECGPGGFNVERSKAEYTEPGVQ